MPFTKNNVLSIAVIVLLLLNIITVASFWFGYRPLHHPQQPLNERPPLIALEKELNFTEGQKEQFRKLREEHFSKNEALLDSLKNARDAYFDLLKQNEVSDSALAATHNKTARWQKEIDMAVFKHFQQVRLLCDDTQKKKFDSFIKDVIRQLGKPKPPHQKDVRKANEPLPPGPEEEHKGPPLPPEQ